MRQTRLQCRVHPSPCKSRILVPTSNLNFIITAPDMCIYPTSNQPLSSPSIFSPRPLKPRQTQFAPGFLPRNSIQRLAPEHTTQYPSSVTHRCQSFVVRKRASSFLRAQGLGTIWTGHRKPTALAFRDQNAVLQLEAIPLDLDRTSCSIASLNQDLRFRKEEPSSPRGPRLSKWVLGVTRFPRRCEPTLGLKFRSHPARNE